jgi:nitrite reductase/ring-hydroxylating ferredoxin subunit
MSNIVTRICAVTDVPVNSIRRFEIDGHAIALYNINGVFYATDDACTHGMSSLSQGELDGDVVECSLHLGAFHVPTGKPAGAPCSIPLQVYHTEVKDGEIRVYRTARAGDKEDPSWSPVHIR